MPISALGTERAVKLLVMGRKAWLFSNTPKGAEASCAIYSIVNTAIANGLSPFLYVEWLLEEMPRMRKRELGDGEAMARLLPWSPEIPDALRVRRAQTD